MKNPAKFEMDAHGDLDGWRSGKRKVLHRWATLNSKLFRKEFFWSFEMKLTVFVCSLPLQWALRARLNTCL